MIFLSISIIFIIIPVIAECNDEYFAVDKSNWIEPGNMFEERKLSSHHKDEGKDDSAISNCKCSNQPVNNVEDCSEIKKELNSCQKEVKSLKSLLNSKSCGYRASAFFKTNRFQDCKQN